LGVLRVVPSYTLSGEKPAPTIPLLGTLDMWVPAFAGKRY
jgi:hypothetical protein